MQAGLLGKRFQRSAERLRGYRGDERFVPIGLGKRGGGNTPKRKRADGKRAQHSRHQSGDLCR